MKSTRALNSHALLLYTCARAHTHTHTHTHTRTHARTHARMQVHTHLRIENLKMQGKLHEALQGMLNLEKVGRLAEDVTATKAACSAILEACHQTKEWRLMEEQIMVLAKRRSQLKQV